MNTFSEYHKELTEQAQAKKGDRKGSTYYLENISEFGIINDFEIINDTFKTPKINGKDTFILIKSKLTHMFKVGDWVSNTNDTKDGSTSKQFQVLFSIQFKEEKLKDYKNAFSVPGVAVDLALASKKGLASFMYKFFVKEMGYTVVGDSEQYFGARKLWSKLSNSIDVKVDIYDIQKQELIFSDVILHHGHYNSDFDERLWSYSKSKLNLRSILTDIGD
jgi:hypothetical protein